MSEADGRLPLSYIACVIIIIFLLLFGVDLVLVGTFLLRSIPTEVTWSSLHGALSFFHTDLCYKSAALRASSIGTAFCLSKGWRNSLGVQTNKKRWRRTWRCYNTPSELSWFLGLLPATDSEGYSAWSWVIIERTQGWQMNMLSKKVCCLDLGEYYID